MFMLLTVPPSAAVLAAAAPPCGGAPPAHGQMPLAAAPAPQPCPGDSPLQLESSSRDSAASLSGHHAHF
jgi:hypothetical protein